MNKIRYCDICAGIGGFRLGARNHPNWECVFSCEIDDQCEKTYFLNYKENFTFKDIFDIDEKQLPDFDVLCAGFPCQPFSIAGKQKGLEDERGTIIFKIFSIVKEKKPAVVFLENVPNIIRHDKGNTIRIIKESFSNIGYDFNIEILNSKNFGVPQSRPRAYFVAFRSDIDSSRFSFNKGTSKIVSVKHIIKESDDSIPISSRWNEYILLYQNKITVSDMSFVPPKTRTSLEQIGKNVDLEDCIFQIRSSGIRAVSMDEPFPTFAVSISGGGAMIPVLSKQKRHLCVDEIKAIMGFPNDFSFNVSRTYAIKQLANAVCPPVIDSIICDIEKII